jgi:hypothetical protein
MLTIFSTPKPFRGHIGTIQRNAIQSWKRLHPSVDVILFGDDEGAAETALEFGLRHVPDVPRNEFGTKFLRGFFEPAQQMARYDRLCYVNCDIILSKGLVSAIDVAASNFQKYLVVGRRLDTDIAEPWNFADPAWEERLVTFTQKGGRLAAPWFIDYFAFSRGLYEDIPPLVIGRIHWDHWLIWKARSSGAAVIDASHSVLAIHQNHDYSYHPRGVAGVWGDEQSARNFELVGGRSRHCTIQSSTHKLTENGLRRNWTGPFAVYWGFGLLKMTSAWIKLLDITLPIRSRLGLRRKPKADSAMAPRRI